MAIDCLKKFDILCIKTIQRVLNVAYVEPSILYVKKPNDKG